MVTLNLPTTQDLFSYVERHLLTQNEQALNSHGNCHYRIERDGKLLKCAVGCLIIDKHYQDNLEDKLSNDHNVVTAISLSIGRELTSKEMEILRNVQVIHDSHIPSAWPDPLNALAQRYGLVSKALNWTPTQNA